MARYDPSDYGAHHPAVYGNSGYGSSPQPDPTPGWRKPLALVGWGALIAALIGVIIYGIIELAHGRPTPASITKTRTVTSSVTPVTTTTTPPATTTRTSTTTTTTPSTPGPLPVPPLPPGF